MSNTQRALLSRALADELNAEAVRNSRKNERSFVAYKCARAKGLREVPTDKTDGWPGIYMTREILGVTVTVILTASYARPFCAVDDRRTHDITYSRVVSQEKGSTH